MLHCNVKNRKQMLASFNNVSLLLLLRLKPISDFSFDNFCMESNKLKNNNTKQTQLILCKVRICIFLIKLILCRIRLTIAALCKRPQNI